MDPENEDSDVSSSEADLRGFERPVGLPPAPSKQALENQQTLSDRLSELESIENRNIQRHDLLKEKRARMDGRIASHRAAQDAKIRAIMDARARRDTLIMQRRNREDISFQRFYEELEDEETSETPPTRPQEHIQYPPHPAERPPYGYYQSPITHHAPLPQHPYQPGPFYQQPGPAQSPPVTNQPRPTGMNAPPYGPNVPHEPSHMSTPAPVPNSTPQSGPQRQFASHYDTRPPPPAPNSSGFAAVNQPPPHSGFAAVNSRPPATASPDLEASASKDSVQKIHTKPIENTPARASTGEDKSPPGNGSSNKRTPSTTHPYQMSEAFANRHHHCERIDSLNRGIWTWYGPGGKDHPTEPSTEMYLRCNHDGCRRIDWRTVHGLQCHIVKNHEQPKGTIGSLEKALAAYGVPVKEVEEAEERDGLGTGGTMADPKNNKIRSRRLLAERRDMTPAETPITVKQQPPQRSISPSSILPSHKIEAGKQYQVPHDHKDSRAESTPTPMEPQVQFRPSTGFAAVNTGWRPVNAGAHKRQHSNDLEMRDGPHSQSIPQTQIKEKEQEKEDRGQISRPFWQAWPVGPAGTPSPTRSNIPAYTTPGWPGFQPTYNHQPQQLTSSQPQPSLGNPAPVVPQSSSSNISESKLVTEQSRDTVTSASRSSEAPRHDREPHKSQVEASTGCREVTPKREITDENHNEVEPAKDAVPVTGPHRVMPDTDMSSVGTDVQTNQEHEMRPEAPRHMDGVHKNEAAPPPYAKLEQPSKGIDAAHAAPAEEQRAPNSTAQAPAEIPAEKVQDRDAVMGDVKAVVEEDTKPAVKRSPQVSSRRIASRRESRRTSIATAASSKAGTEKSKEDDLDMPVSSRISADEDGDTIVVSKADVKEKKEDKAKDEDKLSTPSRRLPNGRFTRNKR
ncbi:hypothetical protein LTR05_003530 [Lithohypha guttulata]|uniref:Uncharacterized protein n=1 Tax=Lithohypha guttulata TaxID=1690604 RepID=A0AAN7SZT0_9EURO|nr:hypothetical protein LTR05_003530 [Lithohypha guttulata]